MHLRAISSLLFGGTVAESVPVVALIFGVVGCLLWVIAYYLVITRSFKDRTYGIPMAAICMNITWEILSVFFWREVAKEPAFHYADIAWMCMDVIILSQLLLYGRARQTIEGLRSHFYPVVATSLVMAFVGQYTFPQTYHDAHGFVLAFIINLGMSIFFVFMFWARPDRNGVSLSVAWYKMLGTLCESIMCVFWMPAIHHNITDFSFFHYLFIATFAFDCAYIALVWSDRHRRAKEPC